MKDLHDIFINLLGGFLVVVLDRLYLFLKKSFVSHEFKRMFGEDSVRDFHLVYGKMVLKPLLNSSGQLEQWPYAKPGTNKQFRITSPVSFTETKAAKYLAEVFSQRTSYHPTLISDEEIKEKVDVSFCSFGGYNNLKTIDILESDKNAFYEFDLKQGLIKSKKSNKTFAPTPQYDYGVIVKINNKNFENRTQICIAGLGEFGTTGSAWYLSNKWKDILKKVGINEFGCVIKVKAGQDESAEMIEYQF